MQIKLAKLNPKVVRPFLSRTLGVSTTWPESLSKVNFGLN